MEMQVASALALWAAQPLCRFVHDTKVCFTQCQSFFCSFVAIPIQGWRRWEQDVAHQSCNGGGNEVNEHGGAASGDFFLSHIAVNVCRVLISRHASTAGKAPAFTASKAKIDRGCKATKKTAKTSACWREKKKRKKEESYSSYIYKGVCLTWYILISLQSSNRSTPTLVSPTRQWLSLKASWTISSNTKFSLAGAK